MKKFFVVVLTVFSACSQTRVKKYADILDPRLGNAKKQEVGKLLGPPTSCTAEQVGEKCEYRTARARNHPVPDVYRREGSLGPDLSPYDQFDVLQLRFDGFGVLKEWEPIFIHQD